MIGMEWQPIDTAPRDGTRILLAWAGSEVTEGYWMGDSSRNYWGVVGWFSIDEDVLTSRPSRPSHWMPLPQPPPAASVP